MRRFASLIAFILAAGFYHPTQAAPTSAKSAAVNSGAEIGNIAGSLQTTAGNSSAADLLAPTSGDSAHLNLSIAAPAAPDPFNAAEILQQSANNVPGDPAPEIRDALASAQTADGTARAVQATGKRMSSLQKDFRGRGLIETKSAELNPNAGREFFDMGEEGAKENSIWEGILPGTGRRSGLARNHPSPKTASALAAVAAVTLFSGAGPGNLGGLTTLVYFVLLAVAASAMLAPLFRPVLPKMISSPSTRAILEQGFLIQTLQDIPGVMRVRYDPDAKRMDVFFGNTKQLEKARAAGSLPDKIGDFSVLYHS